MTHSRTRRAALGALLTAAALAACSEDTTLEPLPSTSAVVTFAFEGHPADTIRVLVHDSATIADAERYVQTKSGPRLLIGTIERGVGHDPRYPFRFVPSTVRLADMAMEVCDGAPMRTAAALDDFFEWSTGSRTSTTTTWCPWASYPVAVVRPAAP